MKVLKIISRKKGYLTCFLVLLFLVNSIASAEEDNTSKRQIGRAGWAKIGDSVHTSLAERRLQPKQAALFQQQSMPSVSFTCSFDEPTITSSRDEFSQVRIEGLDQWNGNPGAPILPFKPVKLLIPHGKDPVGVSVGLGRKIEIPGKYILEPAQKPVPLSQLDKASLTPPDPEIYNSDEIYPVIPCGDALLQKKHGFSILIVNLFPVEYSPVTGKISYYREMTIQVEAIPAFMQSVAFSAQTKTKITNIKPNPKKTNEIRSIINNPETLDAYIIPPKYDLGVKQTLQAALEQEEYQYVIIATNDLRDAQGEYTLQDLISAKEARGLTAKLVTVEDDIYPHYDGTRPSGGEDNQTKIRNLIIDYYTNHGTEYVLLAGDKDNIPLRMFFVSAGPYTTSMPADMYYACLDGTFDGNTNGAYGELNDGLEGGDVDLFAEVYVGRAPVADAGEISNFVKKTLIYEGAIDDYLRTVYMVGEHLGFGGVSDYAKNSMEEIRLGSSEHGYATIGFENSVASDYFNTQTLYDADALWSAPELVEIMNSGVHIINHLGHANYTYDMKLDTKDLSDLTNDDYFFAYSQGCLPGGFDTPECFAEVITTMEKGAFAVVMNARYGWGMSFSTAGPSQYYDREFWDAMLGEAIVSLGRMNQDSKEDNIERINAECMRWCYYELNLFGDPELAIHSDMQGVEIAVTAPLDQSYVGANPGAPIVDITGSAYMESDFARYELYYTSIDDPENPTLITSSNTPVQNGLLGRWDTTQCSDGEYVLTLKIFATNNHEITASISVTVDNVSQSPEFMNLTDRGITTGKLLRFGLEGRDPDDPGTPWGALEISADNLPDGASFDSQNQVFSWCPSDSDRGSHEISFTIQDNEHIVTKNITITVILMKEERMPVHSGALPIRPAIYKDKLAWEDYRQEKIYLYDLSTGKQMRVSLADSWQFVADIYEDKIVWQDAPTRYEDYDICMYDLSTREETRITPIDRHQTSPCIDGNIIAWDDNRNRGHHLYMYDLSTGEESWVCPGILGHQMYANVQGGRIVWMDSRNGNWDIYMYDLSTGEERQITDDPEWQVFPVIYGDKIVWQDNRNGNEDIYMCDLSTGEETRITTDESAQYYPAIYKNRIVWMDFRNGESDIYMYDISTGVEIQLTSDTEAQWGFFDIYEDIIVWYQADFIEWESEIYIARIYNIPEISSVDPTTVIPGDLVTIAGGNFGAIQGGSYVEFYPGVNADCVKWSVNEIVCIVPQEAQTGTVKVVNLAGESNGINVTISQGALPAPANLSAVAISKTQVDLDWQDNSDNENGFKIERSLNSVDFAQIADVPANTTGYSDPNRTHFETYYYRVKAYNNQGNSGYSNIVSIRANRPPVLDPIGNKEVKQGEVLEFTVTASDSDGDPLGYLAENLPRGAVFTNRIFSWRPPYNIEGSYDVTFKVSDKYSEDSETITITLIIEEVIIEKTQITTSHSKYPDIYGDKIVWQDLRNGNWDIYMYDLSTEEEIQITTDPGYQILPAIYEDKIVWQDFRNGDPVQYLNPDIYMYDLSTEEKVQITSNPELQTRPAIYGDRIVWQDSRNGNWDIYMYDLSKEKEIQISGNPGGDEYPSIYKDKIVWQGYGGSNGYDIFIYDLSTGNMTHQAIPNWQCEPVIHEDKIVWYDDRNTEGYNLIFDIYMYDLSTREEVRVTDNPEARYKLCPDIYGDKIVWENQSSVGFYDIYMHDLSEERDIEIATDRIHQKSPAIYKHTVVWEQNGNIYMARISFIPQIITVNPTEVCAGDLITITGKNFGYKQENSYVKFYPGVNAEIVKWSGNEIICQVPGDALSGALKVVTEGGESKEVSVTITQGALSAPSGLAVTLVSTDRVNLSWQDNSAIEQGYKIERTLDLHNFTQIATEPVNAVGYSDEPLTHLETYYYRVRAYNIQGNSGYSNVASIYVNKAPVLDPIGYKEITEGGLLEFTISATDLDGDALTFSASYRPDGATFDPATRTFSWIPTHYQAGTCEIIFRASDGYLEASETIVITVNNANGPPVLDPIGDRTVNKGGVLEFTISATDPDNDALTYSVSDLLPPGASFNPSSRIFRWAPPSGQVGKKYQVTFTVSDNESEDCETITIVNILVEIVPICVLTDSNQYGPAIYGDKIVWFDDRNNCELDDIADIYMYDLSTNQERRLTTHRSCWFPDIYEDKIAYSYWNRGYGVRMYDLSLDREISIYNGGTGKIVQPYSVIDGDKIVWAEEPKREDKDICMYDLSTGTKTQLTTDPLDDMRPAISGDKIVWKRTDGYEPEIYMYNVSSQEETRVPFSNPSHNPIYGSPVIYGDKIACVGRWNGIYIYDLSSQEEKEIPADCWSNAVPSIYEDKIVWEDKGSGNRNIYMYDFFTDFRYQIINGIGDQLSPLYLDIYENIIVYCNRYDIYMAKVFLPPGILSVEPDTVATGEMITITGGNFGYEKEDASFYVEFAPGVRSDIESWSNSEIKCWVPYDAETGPVKVINPGGESNGYEITISGSVPNYTITIISDGEGSVAKEPDQSRYVEGAEITLSAKAGPGYEFDGWSGDLFGYDNPMSFRIYEDMNITAHFTESSGIPGDITGPEGVPDGKVDILDLVLVAQAFGSTPDDPSWDGRADIAPDPPDNYIDIRDLVVVAINFGRVA